MLGGYSITEAARTFLRSWSPSRWEPTFRKVEDAALSARVVPRSSGRDAAERALADLDAGVVVVNQLVAVDSPVVPAH